MSAGGSRFCLDHANRKLGGSRLGSPTDLNFPFADDPLLTPPGDGPITKIEVAQPSHAVANFFCPAAFFAPEIDFVFR
jgi:hypothetical protein